MIRLRNSSSLVTELFVCFDHCCISSTWYESLAHSERSVQLNECVNKEWMEECTDLVAESQDLGKVIFGRGCWKPGYGRLRSSQNVRTVAQLRSASHVPDTKQSPWHSFSLPSSPIQSTFVARVLQKRKPCLGPTAKKIGTKM